MYNKHTEESQATQIEIRPTQPTDMDELRRVAQRDTRTLPDGELLVALVDGEPRAAVSLASGDAIADPFHRTDELVRMLRLQRLELRRGTPRSPSLGPPLRPSLDPC